LWFHLFDTLKNFGGNLFDDSNSLVGSSGDESALTSISESVGSSNAPQFNVEKHNKTKEIIDYLIQDTTRDQKCLVIRYCLDKINENLTASERLCLEGDIKLIIEKPKENNFSKTTLD